MMPPGNNDMNEHAESGTAATTARQGSRWYTTGERFGGYNTGRQNVSLDETTEDPASAPPMIVALDVDEVLVCYVDGFRKFLMRERPEGPFDVQSIFREAHDPNNPWRQEFALNGGLDNLEAVPGAVAALRRLRLAGVQLEVVTSRAPVMRQSTEALLSRLFPPGTFSAAHFIAGGDKGVTCKTIGACALVDDQIPNVLDANACGVISVLFDFGGSYPWSVCSPEELPAGVMRLESWAATCEYLLSALKCNINGGGAALGRNGNPQSPLSMDGFGQVLRQHSQPLQQEHSSLAMIRTHGQRSPSRERREFDEPHSRSYPLAGMRSPQMDHRRVPDSPHVDSRRLPESSQIDHRWAPDASSQHVGHRRLPEYGLNGQRPYLDGSDSQSRVVRSTTWAQSTSQGPPGRLVAVLGKSDGPVTPPRSPSPSSRGRGMALAALPGGRYPSQPPSQRHSSQVETMSGDAENLGALGELTGSASNGQRPFWSSPRHLPSSSPRMHPTLQPKRDSFVEHNEGAQSFSVRESGGGYSGGHAAWDEKLDQAAALQPIIVALDVDEVLVCYMEGFRKFLVRERPDGPLDTQTVFREAHDPNSPWRHQFASNGGLDNLDAVPGAVAALRRLKLAGVRLEVVTSRPPSMRQSTEALLGRIFLPGTFSAAHFVNGGEKGRTCKSIGAHALVDDQIPNAIDANNCGVISVLFDFGGSYPWSVCNPEELPAGVMRLESWAATCEYLLSALPFGSNHGVAAGGNGNPQAPLSSTDAYGDSRLQHWQLLQRSQGAGGEMNVERRGRDEVPERQFHNTAASRYHSQPPDSSRADHRRLYEHSIHHQQQALHVQPRQFHAYEGPRSFERSNDWAKPGPQSGPMFGTSPSRVPGSGEDPPACTIS